jgi:hypothetical protein
MPDKPEPRPAPGNPPPEGEAPPKRKRDFLTGCALVMLGIVIVFGLLGGCWTHRVGKARQQFAARVYALLEYHRADRPYVPEEENAAPLYRQAFRLFVSHPDSSFYDRYSNKSGPLHAEGRDFRTDDVAQHLADNGPYLAALRAAAARAKCDFGMDLKATGGGRPDWSHGGNLRSGVDFLIAGARRAAQSGRPAEALDLIDLGLRLARDSGREGVNFSRQTSGESALTAALQAVLNESEPSAADIEKLIGALDRHRAGRTGPAQALLAQKLIAMGWLADVNAGRADLAQVFGDSNLLRDAVFSTWLQSGLGLKDALRTERLLDEAIAAAELEYPRALDELAGVRARAGNAPFWAWGSQLGAFSFRLDIGENDAQALANLTAARLGAGCRLYRIKHGRLPADLALAELQSAFPEHFRELPADPFSGKPFIYEISPGLDERPESCTVYSVGRDRVDNGGIRYDPRNPRAPSDLVFELKK